MTHQTVDFVDHNGGRFYVGISAFVKVQLKDGTFHEDIGYGVSEGMRSKALSIEKARKEAVTDGLKRALKSFGNGLGNCLGDMNYLKFISRAPKPVAEAMDMSDFKHHLQNANIERSRYVTARPVERVLAMPAADSTGAAVSHADRDTDSARPAVMSVSGVPQKEQAVAATMAPIHSNGEYTPSTSAATASISGDSVEKVQRKLRQQQKQREFQLRKQRGSVTAHDPVPQKGEFGTPQANSRSAAVLRTAVTPMGAVTDADDKSAKLIAEDGFDDPDLWNQTIGMDDMLSAMQDAESECDSPSVNRTAGPAPNHHMTTRNRTPLKSIPRSSLGSCQGDGQLSGARRQGCVNVNGRQDQGKMDCKKRRLDSL